MLGIVTAFAFKDVKPYPSDKKHLSFFDLLAKREIQIISIPSFIHGILKENISLWMTVYIIDTYCVDLGTSAYYLLLIPIFGFLGRFVHQFFYRIAKENEHTVSLIAFVFAIAFSLMLVFEVSAVYSILCLTVLYGLISMINTSFLSIYPHRFRHEGNVSSVGGLIDFVTYLGAAVGSLVFGVLIKQFGYNSMFISWAAVSAVGAAVISKFIKKEVKQNEKVSSS